MTTGPGYVALVALHALAAVVGFGALGATGAHAAALRRDPARAGSPAVRRFFRPGRNWASLAVLPVPLLGGALLALGNGSDVTRAFPWIGLGCWVVAVGAASAVLWPAERAVQRLLAGPEGEGAGEREGRPSGERAVVGEALVAACARCERAAAVTSLCFAIALVAMIAQP